VLKVDQIRPLVKKLTSDYRTLTYKSSDINYCGENLLYDLLNKYHFSNFIIRHAAVQHA